MPPRNSKFKLTALLFVSLLFVVQPSWAGRVVKVKKGKKIYIKLDPKELDSTFKGDKLYLTTPSGKKRALVLIRKMKGRLVIAQLVKGKAKKGMLTIAQKTKKKRPRNEPMEEATEMAETETETSEHPDMMFGILGAFGSATQNVSGVADMSGSSIGVKGIFDYELFSNLGVRARLGLDMVSVTGGTDYTTDINYLTIDLLLRYYIYRGNSFGLFANLGMGIYSPMSTDMAGGPGNVGALQEDSISTTSLLIFGGGASIPFGSWEIFVGADYLYFPPSDDVDTTVIAAKVGLLFAL